MKKEIKEKFVSVRLPASVKLKLQEICESEGRTLNAQILHYIKKSLVIKKWVFITTKSIECVFLLEIVLIFVSAVNKTFNLKFKQTGATPWTQTTSPS